MKIEPLKHDEFLKRMIGNKKIAKDFFSYHLPSELLKKIDLDSIELCTTNYVEPDLKEYFCDLVFKTKINDKDGYILMLEHQSSVDQTMAYRLWKYTIAILEKYTGDSKRKPSFPTIVPMVLYHGEETYTSALNLWNLFEDPALAKELLTGDYALVDLGRIPDSELKSRNTLGMIQLIMKHIFKPDIMPYLKQAIEMMKDLPVKEAEIYIVSILCYTINKLQKENQAELKTVIEANLKEKAEEIMGTLTESWEKQGIEKGIVIGIEKGREEGAEIKAINIAKNLISENMPLENISRITGLDISKLNSLKSELTESKFKQ